jgi:hypothetical protein
MLSGTAGVSWTLPWAIADPGTATLVAGGVAASIATETTRADRTTPAQDALAAAAGVTWQDAGQLPATTVPDTVTAETGHVHDTPRSVQVLRQSPPIVIDGTLPPSDSVDLYRVPLDPTKPDLRIDLAWNQSGQSVAGRLWIFDENHWVLVEHPLTGTTSTTLVLLSQVAQAAGHSVYIGLSHDAAYSPTSKAVPYQLRVTLEAAGAGSVGGTQSSGARGPLEPTIDALSAPTLARLSALANVPTTFGAAAPPGGGPFATRIVSAGVPPGGSFDTAVPAASTTVSMMGPTAVEAIGTQGTPPLPGWSPPPVGGALADHGPFVGPTRIQAATVDRTLLDSQLPGGFDTTDDESSASPAVGFRHADMPNGARSLEVLASLPIALSAGWARSVSLGSFRSLSHLDASAGPGFVPMYGQARAFGLRSATITARPPILPLPLFEAGSDPARELAILPELPVTALAGSVPVELPRTASDAPPGSAAAAAATAEAEDFETARRPARPIALAIGLTASAGLVLMRVLANDLLAALRRRRPGEPRGRRGVPGLVRPKGARP